MGDSGGNMELGRGEEIGKPHRLNLVRRYRWVEMKGRSGGEARVLSRSDLRLRWCRQQADVCCENVWDLSGHFQRCCVFENDLRTGLPKCDQSDCG